MYFFKLGLDNNKMSDSSAKYALVWMGGSDLLRLFLAIQLHLLLHNHRRLKTSRRLLFKPFWEPVCVEITVRGRISGVGFISPLQL